MESVRAGLVWTSGRARFASSIACRMTGGARCEGSASALAGFCGRQYGTAERYVEARQVDEDMNGVLLRPRSAGCRSLWQYDRIRGSAYNGELDTWAVSQSHCELHHQDHSQSDRGSGRKTAIGGHVWSDGLAREGCWPAVGCSEVKETLAAGTARRRGASESPSVRSIEEWMRLATLRLVTGGWSGGGCRFGAVCRARVGAARRRRGNGLQTAVL